MAKYRKRSERDEAGVVLIEGYREMTRALASGWPMEAVYYCEELFLGENEPEILGHAKTRGAELFACSAAVFRKIAYRDRPEGLLGIAKQLHPGLDDLPEMDNPFLLVAVGIEKPGNLGTMLRSADGAGVDAVIVCDAVTDVFNPNTVRASVGTLFSVPVVESTFEEFLPWLRDQGIPLLAATPHTDRSLYNTRLEGPVAITVGSEMHGLENKWMDAAEIKVSLPMHGIADSLNVSTAAGILLYEVVRQRSRKE